MSRCWVVALFGLAVAAPVRAQSVRSFDDQGAPSGASQAYENQYPNVPPATAPQPQPSYPTAPSPPAAAAPPSQPGYTQSYQQRPAPTASYVLSPPVLIYRDGVAAPEGYVLEKHRNRGLMLGGGLTLGGAYTIGLIYALTKSFDNGTGWLAVPVVGPWGAIKGRTFKCKSDNNVSQEDVDACVDGALNEVTAITFLAVTGLVQAVGATLFFVGVGDVTEQWVRADLADVKVEANVGPVSDGYGFTLSGRF